MDGSGQVAAEPFYTDPDCLRMFRSNVAAVVQRVNSLTGVRYWCVGACTGTPPWGLSVPQCTAWLLGRLTAHCSPWDCGLRRQSRWQVGGVR